ncbi:MAG TPA: SIS domain-containing protein [Candidatus Bathyarchaeia archaeon]|nr:SIS domain-containing protein [Candidatus Bathyarchaeia archaeon]
MNNLDDLQTIKKLDKEGVLESIELFPQQCLQVLQETKKLKLSSLKNKIANIIVSGMGGSAFSVEIIKTLFADEIKVPLEIVRDYHLPKYVDEQTLVLAVSYSGTTAETLSCAQEALAKNSKLLILANNGELANYLNQKNVFGYVFKEKYNPCHQPRTGTGYLVCGALGLLIKSGLIEVSFSGIEKSVKNLFNQYQQNIPLQKNKTKQMSLKLKDKFVLLVSSEFLNGAIHGFANQLNENAKANSTFHYIPELNHHRMEGLGFPKEFKKLSIFLFYLSDLYDRANQIRYKITQKVIEKNGYQVLDYKVVGKDKVSQAFNTIIFNAYVSFYLAILNNVNPNKIPWVDYFKEELRKLNFG